MTPDELPADMEARTPAPEGEAVAWRYRYPNESRWHLTQDYKQAFNEVQPLYASPVVPVGGDDVEVVAEWLEIAKETPKPLHSSLNYVPVCASEIEAIERIIAALRPTDTGWRDIATAPRDGGDILLNCGTDECAIGRPNGDGTFDDGDFRDHMDGFTHWMPLPPAPTNTGANHD
jgi:hypothetical protein